MQLNNSFKHIAISVYKFKLDKQVQKKSKQMKMKGATWDTQPKIKKKNQQIHNYDSKLIKKCFHIIKKHPVEASFRVTALQTLFRCMNYNWRCEWNVSHLKNKWWIYFFFHKKKNIWISLTGIKTFTLILWSWCICMETTRLCDSPLLWESINEILHQLCINSLINWFNTPND